jgi:hypothetical protein
MSDVQDSPADSPARGPSTPPADQAVNRALIGGLVAALLGGVLWAGIVITTKYEVGFVAWAVGGLVGFVMSRVTPSRGQALGTLAALLAVVGLVVGKVLIVTIGTQHQAVLEVEADAELLAQAGLHDLRLTDAMPDPLQERLDALGFNDTIPDALWSDMMAAGTEHATRAGPDEQRRVAAQYADALLENVGLLERLRSQLSPWDLLWFGLAVTTAWRFMRGGSAEAVAEAEA